MNNEAIRNLLQRCRRQWYKPDLHSFKAKIRDGVVFVECYPTYVDISAIVYEAGEEVHKSWRTGAALYDAVEVLEQLGIDLATVET